MMTQRPASIPRPAPATGIRRFAGRQGRARRPFTLIELLVVVSIIAILAALVLPGLAKARLRSVLTVCTSNLHQTHAGLLMYGDDFDGWYPLADEGGAWPPQPPRHEPSAFGWYGPPGFLQTMEYVPSPQALHCAGMGGLTQYGWPWAPFGATKTYLAYTYANLRRCDLWVGTPWRADSRWANSWSGGMLLRCLTVHHERDPRAWTHADWTVEMRNDGRNRLRRIPTTGLIQFSEWNIQVQFPADYDQTDDWWMAE
ncbi:MAG: Type II secretion system protein G precursor [Lentisphaerae bacterium ADurb.BinA184]|nr:MAG: Type II secretion system protein G precursor [Lentisphaerae bacterium ADurb.BinA184]